MPKVTGYSGFSTLTLGPVGDTILIESGIVRIRETIRIS